MPLQATSGAASYDAFGGGVPAVPNYIEDVFSTYLYTGNGSTQTITNGIDLSGKGGATWLKVRDLAGEEPTLFSTDTTYGIGTNTTGFNTRLNSSFWSPTSSGFDILSGNPVENENAKKYVSWTFRKQPKFFDVVTYTGNGTSNRAVSHNLGSIPACIFLKRTDSAASWFVYHRATGGTPQDNILQLNTTDPLATSAGYWGTTPFTDTEFRVSSFGGFNASGGTYVAYVFAHNAGGFGLTGTDNVISCGGFTHAGANAVQTLGYEPQFLLIKKVNDVGDWKIVDTMRGWSVAGPDLNLYPNTSGAEVDSGMYNPVATGFDWGQNGTFIYIAIRRGPMKVPTSGTSVFNSITRTGTGTAATITGVGFAPDLVLGADRTGANTGDDCRYFWVDKLRGRSQYLNTAVTAAEVGASSSTQDVTAFGMDGISVGTTANAYFNVTSDPLIHHYFKRAPSFFDEVCYTGDNASSRTITHNLGVVPEMMIVKRRSGAEDWGVYTAATGNTGSLRLNTSGAFIVQSVVWNNTTPTASVFTVGSNGMVNAGASTYVAYLFATCAGVSKVGSYTGTGATQTINCGFTSGARFVLIKRTDSTGDWYVWDSARGIVSGNDPYLLLNAYAPAENTSTDYVDTYSAGFEISSTAPSAINASGGTFIFLAIA